MKLVYQYMTIFFTLSPTSNHLHPLQVENCDSNSQLVVDEDDKVKSGLKGLNCIFTMEIFSETDQIITLVLTLVCSKIKSISNGRRPIT